MAGVSRTTVSFVLNNVPGASISDATRQRVINAANKLNYYPDATGRKLVSGKSYTLGLVLLQSPEQVFADAFLLQVMLGVEQAVAKEGFYVLLKLLEPHDIDGYSLLIRENHVDGIILSGPRQDDKEIIRLYRENVPIILMGQLPDWDVPYVDINAVEGACIAVQHLIALGHQHIALITNASLEYTSAQQRRLGYNQALKQASLESDSLLIREGNYTPSSGYRAMRELLKASPRPTAVFVASDVVALGAMRAIKQAGLRIPEDIAVVGFDDIPSAEYFDPPITTLRLPAYGLGWAAGERLARLTQGETLEQPGLLLETHLIVRESTVGKAAQ
jgi:DNA-binding LacI/PurR family transcriptional regulator